MTVSAATVSGQVLTSAYVNNNINSGLVYISATTLTASGQNISNAFSSTYNNYHVVVSEVITSATNAGLFFRLGASTTRTDYKYAGLNILPTTGVSSSDFSASSTGAFVSYTKGTGANNVSVSFDLLGASTATVKSYGNFWANGQYNGFISGTDVSLTAQTDINFYVGSGTLTGGVVRIYGYRQA